MTAVRILAGFFLLLYAFLAFAGGADGNKSNALINGAVGVVGVVACVWVIYRFGQSELNWVDWLAALITMGPILYILTFLILKR